jgi:CBS domain-containing protein
LYLSELLKRAAVDAKGQRLGRVVDVIVRLRHADYPLVTGLVVAVGRRRVYIPAQALRSWHTDRIELTSARVDMRSFERRDGEVLLHEDVLGHRLVDIDRARLVRAHDCELASAVDGWTLKGVDVHRLPWLHLPRRHEGHDYRDFSRLEPLIGHEASRPFRNPLGRLRRLKPAQLADLLETTSTAEQHEILTHVHTDPDLEDDVFEELDDERQARLLADRSDAEIADVVVHMRADAAADAIAELPQPRRQGVLDLLPAPQQGKVMIPLGYQTATAGGLMGMDYIALPQHSTVAEALTTVRDATTTQPEALTTIYSVDAHARLVAAASLVHLVQSPTDSTLDQTSEPEPITVKPHADLIEITTVMADFNLLTLPVVDEAGHIIELITIDDILEAAIPHNWRRREPPAPPQPAHSNH